MEADPHPHADEPPPLRVLWLIKGLDVGGAERLLVHGARNHDRQRVSCRVAYLLRSRPALAAEIEQAGVPTICLGARNSIDPRWLARLRRLLRSERFDVVHAHSPLAASGARLVIRSLPAGQRPRLVTTEHNLWDSYARATAAVDRWTAGLDDARLAVSGAVRDSMPARLRASTEVLHQGVDLGELREAAAARAEMRTELGLGDDVVVGTVANLRATKAYPDLLAAARHVCDEVDDVRFLAVGQGPMEQELRELRDGLGLGDRFRFLGFRPDAHRVLAACDVFCLSSRHEGLPIALMEALALGLPVVATSVGGIPEVVTHGREGLLVEPGRPDLLAAALLEVARDPASRAAMAERASARGAALSVEHAMRRTETLYGELTGRAGPEPTPPARRPDPATGSPRPQSSGSTFPS